MKSNDIAFDFKGFNLQYIYLSIYSNDITNIFEQHYLSIHFIALK